MSKRDEGGRRITKAEEKLIEKALAWNDHIDWWIAPTGTDDLIEAIHAVVRERGKKR